MKQKFTKSTKQNSLNGQFNSGFTLIELLVVISIISLLAGIVLTSISTARKRARDTKRLADMNQFSKGLELFFNTYFAYPTGTGAPGTTYTAVGTGALLGSDQMQIVNSSGVFTFTPTYISKVPVAPLPEDNIDTTSCTPSNNSYFYEVANDGSKYTITFCLGANVSGRAVTAGVKYMTNGGLR